MGYTNYWRRTKDFTQEQWERICLDAFEIIGHCQDHGVLVVNEYDSPIEIDTGLPTPPKITPDEIWFNGWRGDGHETFHVTRQRPDVPTWEPGGTESFDFCKTARKPYDLAVQLVLLSMKRHSPKTVKVNSDGEWDNEWVEARRVYKSLFGVDMKCPFSHAKS